MSFLKKIFRKKRYRYLRENPKFSHFEIGNWSYGWPSIRFEECGGKLKIGNYCSIAKKTVIMLGGEHDLSYGTTYTFAQEFPICNIKKSDPIVGMTKGDVEIGSDVWICHGAYIGSGLKIGHGAVIAAMAVVTKDVEPFSIVGGNPAKHIRYRFDQKTRERLLNLAWWDWPHEQVLNAWPYLKKFDIDKLEKMNDTR
ncbi:MAG: CatB-related O-acetyltransferase [Verrucomicrobiota bacterium]|nr:CatB-related O-acetyltransferase [Verrucomicrobiota bacterium]